MVGVTAGSRNLLLGINPPGEGSLAGSPNPAQFVKLGEGRLLCWVDVEEFCEKKVATNSVFQLVLHKRQGWKAPVFYRGTS